MPASNHGLPTSAIREITSSHFGHLILTWSTQGLWGECPSNSFQPSTIFSESSPAPPITSKLLQLSHSQIGKANPQYLFLEINQSCIFFSQSNSLSNPHAGIQRIFFVTSTICSL